MSKLPVATTLALMAALGVGAPRDIFSSFLPRKRKPKEVNVEKMEAARLKRERRVNRNKKLADKTNA